MKIAVTSAGPTLEDKVFTSFGRCPYHLFVNTDDMSFEAVKNPNIDFKGCAGHPTAKLIAKKGANMVLTGTCGPHHIEQLRVLGVGVITGVSNSLKVRQAVEQFMEVSTAVGKIERAEASDKS
jgi:predicted Fe-Mo cluster-binding NifX family protein